MRMAVLTERKRSGFRGFDCKHDRRLGSHPDRSTSGGTHLLFKATLQGRLEPELARQLVEIGALGRIGLIGHKHRGDIHLARKLGG